MKKNYIALSERMNSTSNLIPLILMLIQLNAVYAQCDIEGAIIKIENLPYVQTGLSTCDAGNNLSSSDVVHCGTAGYWDNNEIVFVFSVPGNDFYHITLTNASVNFTSLKLYKGCSLLGKGGVCAGQIASSARDKILWVNLVADETYYLVAGSSNNECFDFDLSIDLPRQCKEPGSEGWPLISLPYSGTGLTTCGMGDDLQAHGAISCGTNSYYVGEDIVFIFEAPSTELYHFSLTNATQAWVSMKLHNGCPLMHQGGACVANTFFQVGNGILKANLQQGQTYYLLVSTNGSS